MPRSDSPYDNQWRALRRSFLTAHRWCRVCGKRAVDVDHIVPIREAPGRRLDWTNLQSLCHEHHSVLTNSYDNPAVRQGCDEDGRPLDRRHPWASDPGVRPRSKRNWMRELLKHGEG